MAGNGTSRSGQGLAAHQLPPDEIIFGHSLEMRRLRQRVEKVCATDVPILLLGAPGTGKEVLARWIHSRSPIKNGPFVKVNCAAIPDLLLESELFGYQKGAFTGANAPKAGRVEMAKGGTLFLDEIADISPGLQAKLLQVLQDGRFSRLGDEEERQMEARVICTCTRQIEEAMETGRFRRDLYYRINVFRAEMRSLSERREDIPALANYFWEQLSKLYEKPVAPLPTRMLRLLQNREWKGNIRELQNRIASYILLGLEETAEDSSAPERHLDGPSNGESPDIFSLKRISERASRELGRGIILQALQANHWNRRRTAEQLKISYRTLLYKIRDAGIPSKRSPKTPVNGHANEDGAREPT